MNILILDVYHIPSIIKIYKTSNGWIRYLILDETNKKKEIISMKGKERDLMNTIKEYSRNNTLLYSIKRINNKYLTNDHIILYSSNISFHFISIYEYDTFYIHTNIEYTNNQSTIHNIHSSLNHSNHFISSFYSKYINDIDNYIYLPIISFISFNNISYSSFYRSYYIYLNNYISNPINQIIPEYSNIFQI